MSGDDRPIFHDEPQQPPSQIVHGVIRDTDDYEDGEELAGQHLPDWGCAGGEDLGGPRPWYNSLPYFVRGDLDGYIFVFSNNIATTLVGCSILGAIFKGASVSDDILWRRVMPGLGLSMLFGTSYYLIQALITAGRRGRRSMTAQPFGINTPGMFAWNSGIIGAVYFNELGRGASKNDAAEMAWSVGCVANLLSGVVNVLMSLIGPYINAAVPMVALLGSLASVGMAYLLTGMLQQQLAVPIIALAPFYIYMMAVYANVAIPKLPQTFLPIIVAAALAWMTGEADADSVHAAIDVVGWSPPLPRFGTFAYTQQAMEYIGLILPVTLTVSVGSIQCRQMATNAGDNYNLRYTMAGDGLATILAACFGCPWGMTVFIGHPAIKGMGAMIGYQWMTGVSFALLSFLGLPKLILAVLPAPCLNAIILFVGLAVCSDALIVTKPRHYPAFFLSLAPALCQWCSEQASALAAEICGLEGSTCAIDARSPEAFNLSPTLRGLKAAGSGFLLSSMYLCSMLVYVVDRNFCKASAWAVVGAISASCGMIHSSKVFWPWRGPDDDSMHLRFTLAYSTCIGVFGFCALMQHVGLIPKGPINSDEKAALDEESTDDQSDGEEDESLSRS